MSAHNDLIGSLGSLVDEGWISRVIGEVKSGKEATVFCCSGGDRAGAGRLLAAKVYRPMETRRFKNDAMYQTGRMHLARPGRTQRAAVNKTRFGRAVQYATWIDNEWATLGLLHRAGADVPQPLARNDHAILMPYIGDQTQAAVKLIEAQMSASHAQQVVDRLLWNIELMLDCDCVHGDLSPYNVLYWRGAVVMIDFPQAIDPRLNPAALPLLSRDIEQICRWASKYGVDRDARQITTGLWNLFIEGDIG